jgi:hypothetical protein
MGVRDQVAGVCLLLLALVFFVPSAQASLGYELDESTPVIDIEGEEPQQVAVDQASQRIYVALPIKSFTKQEFGQIDQLDSTGVATAASPFRAGNQSFFVGVAVNPVTAGIYAAQIKVSKNFGTFGTAQVDQFSSLGTLGTQFAADSGENTTPKIAADSSGRLYFPSGSENAVEILSSSGTLLGTINCSGCPGGGFSNPSGVAIDSNDNVYVVDLGKERVVKFTHSGLSYTFASVIQSGKHAAAVAIDPSDNSVFVGDYSKGSDYHIVAYDSSGTQFDDFGAGLFVGSTLGPDAAGQIAVNATTHELYVSDPDADLLRAFSLVTINPPTATTKPASPIGQVAATLNATVNANFHATTDCHFEYVSDADFLVNGYTNATDAPCSSLPAGSQNTSVSATVGGLSPTTTYHFRVVATNNAGTEEGINRTFTTLATAPSTVTTGASSGVAQTVATLAGKVNPHGGSVSDCHFEYGEGLSFAKSKPCTTPVGFVTTDVSESVEVTGLTAKTGYHYRLSVTSNAGTVVGNVEEFTTLPQPPAVTPEAASGITQTSATIAGAVNPNGGASSCQFEYGTTTSYGSVGQCATNPGGGEVPVAEHLALTGLAVGTTYHYRLVAINAGGTTKGADLSFVTQSPPPPPEPVPSGPVVVVPKPLKCKKGFQKKKIRGKLKCVKKKRHRHR